MYSQLLMVTIVYLESQVYLKAILCCFFINLYAILTFHNFPFRRANMNQLEVASSFTCYLTLLIGVLIFGSSIQDITTILYVLMVLVNLLFVLFMFKVKLGNSYFEFKKGLYVERKIENDQDKPSKPE